VRFALGNAATQLPICTEADLARLLVTPEGEITGGSSKEVGGGPQCPVTFTVTVKKGKPVTFGAEVTGAGRLLLIGSEELPNPQDGFNVNIDLSEVEALEVTTETAGIDPVSGPQTLQYEYTIDDEPTPRIDIGATDVDTVYALAAGERMVELFPAPCSLSPLDTLPNPRPVGVPVPEAEIGKTRFLLDCSGDAGVRVTPAGSCGVGSFDLSIDGGPAIPIPANRDTTIGPLDAGTHTFELVNLPTAVQTVNPSNPVLITVPAGGTVDLDFFVICTTVRPLEELTVNILEIFGRVIGDRMDVTLDPGPGSQTKSVTSSDSTATVVFTNVPVGTYTVQLALIGGECEIELPRNNPRRVSAPGSTTFLIECTP
jgi:hypothetical protein